MRTQCEPGAAEVTDDLLTEGERRERSGDGFGRAGRERQIGHSRGGSRPSRLQPVTREGPERVGVGQCFDGLAVEVRTLDDVADIEVFTVFALGNNFPDGLAAQPADHAKTQTHVLRRFSEQ